MAVRPVAFRAGQREVLSVPAGARLAPEVVTGPAVLLADVSEFQPQIADPVYLAWSKAIIIRAAYGDQHDDAAWYGGGRRDALHAGGVRFLGIYQYVVAGQDPVAQAQALIRLVGKLRPGEKIIGDFEEGPGSQVARRASWALTIHAALGDMPWTYSGLNFAAAAGLAPVDWVAAYQPAEPSPPHRLWQFTDAFTIPGVGPADCSIFHGTIDQLAALAYQPTVVPPVTTLSGDSMFGPLPPGTDVNAPVPAGAKGIRLFCDFTDPAHTAHVRVAAFSAAKGFSQIVIVSLADSKPHDLPFTEHDVTAVSLSHPGAENLTPGFLII